MKVNVRFLSHLSRNMENEHNATPLEIRLNESGTCEDLLLLLKVPLETPIMIFVDGMLVEEKTPLKAGCMVSIIPVIAGG